MELNEKVNSLLIDTLAGLLEEARKYYGFECYLTLDKVGSALKNDLRKAENDYDKVNLLNSYNF